MFYIEHQMDGYVTIGKRQKEGVLCQVLKSLQLRNPLKRSTEVIAATNQSPDEKGKGSITCFYELDKIGLGKSLLKKKSTK